MSIVRTMSQAVEKVTFRVTRWWAGVDKDHYTEKCSGARCVSPPPTITSRACLTTLLGVLASYCEKNIPPKRARKRTTTMLIIMPTTSRDPNNHQFTGDFISCVEMIIVTNKMTRELTIPGIIIKNKKKNARVNTTKETIMLAIKTMDKMVLIILEILHENTRIIPAAIPPIAPPITPKPGILYIVHTS